MKEHVKLRKHGRFYSAYEEDAYVIHSILGYKVSNGRIGFPINALGKVQNELELAQVNYVIIEDDKEVEKKKFKDNNYKKHLTLGKRNSKEELKEQELITKISNLDKDKTAKIIEYIEKVVNE